MIFGTPEYMSPEQAQGHQPDQRVDVYAVGCIMYHMLTGSVPFTADSFMGILTKHLLEPAVPPRKRRPDLDILPEVEAICLRAMEKERDKRFPDMDSFYRALGAAGGMPFEPSGVFMAPKANLRYPALAEPNPDARDSRTAIAASGPHGTFEDERPVRPAAGLGGGKVAAIAAGLLVLAGVAFLALRGGHKPDGKLEAAVAPTAAAVVAAPPPPPPAAVTPPPPAPAAVAASAETVEVKPSARAHHRRGAGDEPKADPAHRQIPLPADDTTPAELKNPFHTP
jgi:serine/threonine-protein kinase